MHWSQYLHHKKEPLIEHDKQYDSLFLISYHALMSKLNETTIGKTHSIECLVPYSLHTFSTMETPSSQLWKGKERDERYPGANETKKTTMQTK